MTRAVITTCSILLLGAGCRLALPYSPQASESTAVTPTDGGPTDRSATEGSTPTDAEPLDATRIDAPRVDGPAADGPPTPPDALLPADATSPTLDTLLLPDTLGQPDALALPDASAIDAAGCPDSLDCQDPAKWTITSGNCGALACEVSCGTRELSCDHPYDADATTCLCLRCGQPVATKTYVTSANSALTTAQAEGFCMP